MVLAGLDPDERVCPFLVEVSKLVRPGLQFERDRAEVVFKRLERRALEPRPGPGPGPDSLVAESTPRS